MASFVVSRQIFMTKAVIFLIIIGTILGFLGYFGFNVYNQVYGVPPNAPSGEYSLEVKSGETLNTAAKTLEKDKVIYSSSSFLLLERINPIKPLQKGIYKLALNKTKPEDLLKLIDIQTEILGQVAQTDKLPTTKITFKEGETIDQMIPKLVAAKVASEADILAYIKNVANFDKTKYEFLPPALTCDYGDLKNCAKYYLEGYLYPDTYDFFVPTAPQDIFSKFLGNFNTKVWLKLKPQIKDKDFYKVVTMASVMEKETGRSRGVTAATKDDLFKERKLMAQVFYNRVDGGFPWQSDVTAEYGTGRKLCQQTFKIENCMFLDDPITNNKFNT